MKAKSDCCDGALWLWESIGGMRLVVMDGRRKRYRAKCSKCHREALLTSSGKRPAE